MSTISIAEWPQMPISGLPEFGQGVPFGLVAPIERRHNATAGIDPRPAIRSGLVCDWPPAVTPHLGWSVDFGHLLAGSQAVLQHIDRYRHSGGRIFRRPCKGPIWDCIRLIRQLRRAGRSGGISRRPAQCRAGAECCRAAQRPRLNGIDDLLFEQAAGLQSETSVSTGSNRSRVRGTGGTVFC